MSRTARLGVLFGVVLGLAGGLPADERPEPDGHSILVPMAPPRRPVGDLLVALRSGEAAVRAGAAWELAGARGVKAIVVDALYAASRDPERAVRYAASWALGHVTLDPSGLEVSDEPVPPRNEVSARPVRLTRPEYPPAAFAKRVQGSVVMDILIGEEGEVAHAEVRRSVPALDESALACVRAWRFEPARRGGQPVASVAPAPVSYKVFN